MTSRHAPNHPQVLNNSSFWSSPWHFLKTIFVILTNLTVTLSVICVLAAPGLNPDEGMMVKFYGDSGWVVLCEKKSIRLWEKLYDHETWLRAQEFHLRRWVWGMVQSIQTPSLGVITQSWIGTQFSTIICVTVTYIVSFTETNI